jgi:hypothetical protein
MLFDILAVFVVSLISSLFLCTTSVHSLPSSPSTLHYIHNSPSDDLSSSLRLLNHRPVPSVDNDSGGDISEMLIGESNENEDSSLSSIHASNEPFEYYIQPSSSKFLLRKLLQEQKQQQQQKRSSSPTQFNVNSAVAALTASNNANSAVNLNELKESIRLSPSLKALIEANPFARVWLTILLKKLMEEQPAPYIFKYGRRRK